MPSLQAWGLGQGGQGQPAGTVDQSTKPWLPCGICGWDRKGLSSSFQSWCSKRTCQKSLLSGKVTCGLSSEVTKHHFHHIPFAWAVTEVHPFSKDIGPSTPALMKGASNNCRTMFKTTALFSSVPQEHLQFSSRLNAKLCPSVPTT